MAGPSRFAFFSFYSGCELVSRSRLGGQAVWNNDNIVLFHGCSEESLHSANPRGIVAGQLPHGIDLTACARRTEFGRGFYTTTWIEQAKEWANRQTKKLKARGAGKSSRKAIVLGLSVDRDKLAALDSLVFTNDLTGAAFWSFCTPGASRRFRTVSSHPIIDLDLLGVE